MADTPTFFFFPCTISPFLLLSVAVTEKYPSNIPFTGVEKHDWEVIINVELVVTLFTKGPNERRLSTHTSIRSWLNYRVAVVSTCRTRLFKYNFLKSISSKASQVFSANNAAILNLNLSEMHCERRFCWSCLVVLSLWWSLIQWLRCETELASLRMELAEHSERVTVTHVQSSVERKVCRWCKCNKLVLFFPVLISVQVLMWFRNSAIWGDNQPFEGRQRSLGAGTVHSAWAIGMHKSKLFLNLLSRGKSFTISLVLGFLIRFMLEVFFFVVIQFVYILFKVRAWCCASIARTQWGAGNGHEKWKPKVRWKRWFLQFHFHAIFPSVFSCLQYFPNFIITTVHYLRAQLPNLSSNS